MTRTTNPNLAAILPDLNEGWSWSVEFGKVSEIKLHDPNGKTYTKEIRYMSKPEWWVYDTVSVSEITDSLLNENATELLEETQREWERDQRVRELNARFVDEEDDDV